MELLPVCIQFLVGANIERAIYGVEQCHTLNDSE